MSGKSLMERLLDAGYPAEEMYHYESDLYIFATNKTGLLYKNGARIMVCGVTCFAHFSLIRSRVARCTTAPSSTHLIGKESVTHDRP